VREPRARRTPSCATISLDRSSCRSLTPPSIHAIGQSRNARTESQGTRGRFPSGRDSLRPRRIAGCPLLTPGDQPHSTRGPALLGRKTLASAWRTATDRTLSSATTGRRHAVGWALAIAQSRASRCRVRTIAFRLAQAVEMPGWATSCCRRSARGATPNRLTKAVVQLHGGGPGAMWPGRGHYRLRDSRRRLSGNRPGPAFRMSDTPTFMMVRTIFGGHTAAGKGARDV
jgi:hypothetical protein